MKEYVAVNDSIGIFNLNALKRQALMFDRIAVPFFSSINAELMDASSRLRQPISEVEWLLGQDIVFEPELDFDNEKLTVNDEFRSFVHANFTESERIAVELGKDININLIGEGVSEETLAQILHKVKAGVAMIGFNARYISAAMRAQGNMVAYAVLSTTIPWSDSRVAPISREVLQIVLNALPVPDESTPWEQIIEYRGTKTRATSSWICAIG